MQIRSLSCDNLFSFRWEREYDHSALPGKWSALPDMTEVAKKYQQGDPKTRQIWDDYKVRQAWNEELKAVDPELWNEDFDQPRLPKDMPWNAAYESRSVENILDDQESAGKSYFQVSRGWHAVSLPLFLLCRDHSHSPGN